MPTPRRWPVRCPRLRPGVTNDDNEAKSIQTRNQQRDQQLRSRYLATADYPAINFTSTAIEQVDQIHFRVTGELTIRGVTRPVTVDFELTGIENDGRNSRVRFSGSAVINRKDWGVHWKAAPGLVSKMVRLEFDVAASALVHGYPDGGPLSFGIAK